ncbi:MAG: hypothetical protein ACREQ5_05420 [Candidatus Dormibacteria bacterium]
MPNTQSHRGTISELLSGFYINGGTWFDARAEQTLEEKRKKVKASEYEIEDGRAKVMAEEFIQACAKFGFRGVKKVYWTAKPGDVQRVIDPSNKLHLDPKGNPSDLIVEFHQGGFMGLSAKSTGKKSGKITFKNPGLGTVEKTLHIQLYRILDKYIEAVVKKYHLPTQTNLRKQELKKLASMKSSIASKVEELGTEAQTKIRDAIFNQVRRMRDKDIKAWIAKEWMNIVDSGNIPTYLKVTGIGDKPPFRAKVEDPTKNEAVDAMNNNTNHIRLEKEGELAMRVYAGQHRIMKIRTKFESTKLASSLKFSAEPM